MKKVGDRKKKLLKKFVEMKMQKPDDKNPRNSLLSDSKQVKAGTGKAKHNLSEKIRSKIKQNMKHSRHNLF